MEKIIYDVVLSLASGTVEFFTKLVQIGITALAGFISFHIYQRYRNKKDNCELFIQLSKMNSELKTNLSELEYYIRKHDQHKKLKTKYIDNPKGDLLSIFEVFDELGHYEHTELISDEYGEPIEVETSIGEYKYDEIRHLEDTLYWEFKRGTPEYESVSAQVDELRKRTIFDDIVNLQVLIERLPEQDMNIALLSLLNIIRTFNRLEGTEKKKKKLQTVYDQINAKDKPFTNMMEEYKTLKGLRKDLGINRQSDYTPIISITALSEWEDMDIFTLAGFDIEGYIRLETYYTKMGECEIAINDEAKLRKTHSEMTKIIYGVVEKNLKKVKGVLATTNTIFKNL